MSEGVSIFIVHLSESRIKGMTQMTEILFSHRLGNCKEGDENSGAMELRG